LVLSALVLSEARLELTLLVLVTELEVLELVELLLSAALATGAANINTVPDNIREAINLFCIILHSHSFLERLYYFYIFYFLRFIFFSINKFVNTKNYT